MHFLFLFLLLFADSKTQSLEGKVVRVKDGDTVVVLVDKVQHDVRLEGIDTPESGQDYGTQAKKALSDIVFGKTVKVEWEKLDRYQRKLGKVTVDGKWVNKEMVEEGFAWHYKQYSKDKDLSAAEEQARKAKKGLWEKPNPTPPWEFRRSKEKKQTIKSK